MFSQSIKLSIVVLALPLVLSFLTDGSAHQHRGARARTHRSGRKMQNAKTGLWGGQHIRLEITAQGGQVEYDCGHGTIDQRLVVDAQGRFDVRGTHFREHGGPVRRDEPDNSHPARYVGRIEGETMTLKVSETDTGEQVGTFTLGFGKQGRIVKCR